jgi:hypothetical protein
VARRVAVARDGGDAGKHFALLKQPRAVFVRRDLLPRAHEIKPPLALGRLGHGVVVEPMRRLVLVHDQFGVGEITAPGFREVGLFGRRHFCSWHKADMPAH